MKRVLLISSIVIFLQACVSSPQVSLDTPPITPTYKVLTSDIPAPTKTPSPPHTLTFTPTITQIPTSTQIPSRTPTSTYTSTPTSPPVGGGEGVVYYGDDDGINRINPDGSQRSRIITITNEYFSLRESTKDGKFLSYHEPGKGYRISNDGKIIECIEGKMFSLNTDGSFFNPNSYSFIPEGFFGSLSSDDRYAAGSVKVKEPNYRDLVVANMSEKQSTTIVTTAFFKSWSPDSSRILYAKWTSKKGCADWWTINPDGTDKRKVFECEGKPWGGIWSPGSEYIAFYLIPGYMGCSIDIKILEVISTKWWPLTLGKNVCSYDWSPDGKFMVYTADPDKNGKFEIYIINVETKETNKVLENLDSTKGILWR